MRDCDGLGSMGWGLGMDPDPVVISTLSRASIGEIITSCQDTAVSQAWTNANLAIFIPFSVGRTYTITTCFWTNGTVSSGNCDFGIYDLTGTRKGSIGSTAQGTVSVIQSVALSLTLTAGDYFMGFAMDNTTGTTVATALSLQKPRCYGVRNLASSFPLPASVSTWAGATVTGNLPFIGFTNLATF